MRTLRALFIGVLIWVAGVGIFLASYFLPIMENRDLQANIVLSLAIIPLVWLGAKFYYKKDLSTSGLLVGVLMLLTSAVLDALITVPFMMQPYGISHYDFFTEPGFWLIALEFVITTMVYRYARVRPKANKLLQS